MRAFTNWRKVLQACEFSSGAAGVNRRALQVVRLFDNKLSASRWHQGGSAAPRVFRRSFRDAIARGRSPLFEHVLSRRSPISGNASLIERPHREKSCTRVPERASTRKPSWFNSKTHPSLLKGAGCRTHWQRSAVPIGAILGSGRTAETWGRSKRFSAGATSRRPGGRTADSTPRSRARDSALSDGPRRRISGTRRRTHRRPVRLRRHRSRRTGIASAPSTDRRRQSQSGATVGSDSEPYNPRHWRNCRPAAAYGTASGIGSGTVAPFHSFRLAYSIPTPASIQLIASRTAGSRWLSFSLDTISPTVRCRT